ncbi:MAG: hypothetical protein HN472_04915 [Nitrospina sp.]|jgi:hypothetical protein|nr:hypothetical protein [Nitrospina sp.]MBT3508872.1 hypothetical protein [Nitrospina sp.]MBT3874640.1 hypothetical protein [Nitrospina sp.]MBT4047748.1 hypothetical protein [Nitrospina sp.]MBT4556706.1 hypothetical protein [Nitrospina sp.]
MNLIFKILLVLLMALPACSGVDSVTKKRWSNSENTISIVDMTSRDFRLMDAGSKMQGAIEDQLQFTGYVLSGKNARYHLKYKVIEFEEGSRMARIATMGFADSAKGELRVKAALYDNGSMVGAWEVNSWIAGGIAGGSEDDLFDSAASEIAQHLRGDF